MMNRLRRISRPPIGIDVDGRSIAAVQLAGDPAQQTIEAATVFSRAQPNADISTLEVQRLVDVLYRQGFHGNRVVLAVPNQKLMTSVLELPPASSGAPLAQIARTELAGIHRTDPGNIELSFWDLPARNRASETTQVMAAGCEQSDAHALLDAFESQGLDVVALDIESWAMARACQRHVHAKSGQAALLNLRWDSAVLVLLHQNVVVYERVLAEAGLKSLHESVASLTKLDADVVDYALSTAGVRPKCESGVSADAIVADAQSAITAHFDELVREVRISLSYATHRFGAAPDQLLIMGDGAAMPGLTELLNASLEISSLVVDPAQLGAAAAPAAASFASPALTLAMGLAQHPEG